MARHNVARKKAYHHGDLRQQLIKAADGLIRESGPEQFTLADAARLAGVSIAAPYRHFENRDDLIDAVCIAGMERMGNLMRASMEPADRGSAESIALIGKGYLKFAIDEPEIFRLIFRKVDDEERQCKLDDAGRETYEILLKEVAIRMGKDASDEQVLRASLPLWIFVHGTATLFIDGHIQVADLDVNIADMLDEMTAKLLLATGTEGK